MPGNLKSRLSFLRGDRSDGLKPSGIGRAGVPKKKPSGEIRGLSPEWKSFAEHCYAREVPIPDITPESLGGARFPAGGWTAEDVRFFDTETTGLSGGAGTIVFLLALGGFREGIFHVRQFFLSDYGGEQEFLTRIFKELEGCPVLFSYNGRAFDTQILLNRAAVNRLSYEPPLQEDLLYTARRLWRNAIGSCSLHALEEKLLGIRRQDDVPGSEVPELYHAFLDTKDAGLLEGVFRHNVQDAASLAVLLSRMRAAFDDPFRDGFADPVAVGLWHCMSGGNEEKGRAILEAGFAGKNAAAGRQLGRLYKRRGTWGEAEKVWLTLWESFRDADAAVELAKYYEHRLGRIDKALSLVRAVESLPFKSSWLCRTLTERKARLTRKAGADYFQDLG